MKKRKENEAMIGNVGMNNVGFKGMFKIHYGEDRQKLNQFLFETGYGLHVVHDEHPQQKGVYALISSSEQDEAVKAALSGAGFEENKDYEHKDKHPDVSRSSLENFSWIWHRG